MLFVDVDGVLALWDPVVEVDRVRPAGEAGIPVLIPVGAASRLQRLAAVFEMVWATAWGTDAPEFLGPWLGIGADWPVLDYDGYTWAAICDSAATGRLFAWIDDEAREDELNVREHSQAPHVIVRTDHRVGLNDHAVDHLLTFAAQPRAQPAGPTPSTPMDTDASTCPPQPVPHSSPGRPVTVAHLTRNHMTHACAGRASRSSGPRHLADLHVCAVAWP